MKSNKLKITRIIVSLLFFIPTLLLFIDVDNLLPVQFYNYVLYFQFIPSLIGFGVVSFGLLFVLLLTILFGRVYCSTICPLGILQDIISFLSKKINRKKKYKYLEEKAWIRYSLLAASFLSLASGYLLILNLLDPYSNIGRIFTNLIKPLVIGANNLISMILQYFGNYTFYPVDYKGVLISTFILPIIFLGLILWLSFTKGRLYCNLICPVGTFLGILSKYSRFKITIEKDSCKSCKVCERVCKAGCISTENKSVDFNRCVGCFDCLGVCPTNGIKLKRSSKKKGNLKISESEPDLLKRSFIAKTMIYTLVLAGIDYAQVVIQNKKPTKVPNIKKYPVTPPGSHGIEALNNSCTACHLCVSACPTGVLQPAYLEYGIFGILQPRMDYDKSFCNYECTKCADICPNDAIARIPLEKKKLTQIGKAKFIKENCIVHTENTDCGACSEHCPTKAVSMVPFKNNLYAPEVKDEYCIGCGACEHACPVKPYKAIFVDGNSVHKYAKKPESKKVEQKVNLKEDFPF